VSLWLLDRFAPNLLPAAFARKRLFDALLLARLQIEGVPLDFLDDVFLLYLSLEPSQCVFDGLAILNSNLSQPIHPPSGCNRFSIITYFGGYGDVSIVYYRSSETLLSSEGDAYLFSMLRDKEGNRDRLPVILYLPEGEPLI
jgi:hypothetical protein